MFSFRSILLAAAAFATMTSAIPTGPLPGNGVSGISEATDLLHDLYFGYNTDAASLLLPAPLKRSPQGDGDDSGDETEASPAPLKRSPTPGGDGNDSGYESAKRSPQGGDGNDSGYETEASPAPLKRLPNGGGDDSGGDDSGDETETERRRALGRRLESKSLADIF